MHADKGTKRYERQEESSRRDAGVSCNVTMTDDMGESGE